MLLLQDVFQRDKETEILSGLFFLGEAFPCQHILNPEFIDRLLVPEHLSFHSLFFWWVLRDQDFSFHFIVMPFLQWNESVLKVGSWNRREVKNVSGMRFQDGWTLPIQHSKKRKKDECWINSRLSKEWILRLLEEWLPDLISRMPMNSCFSRIRKKRRTFLSSLSISRSRRKEREKRVQDRWRL